MFARPTAGSLLMIQTGNKDLLLNTNSPNMKGFFMSPGSRQKYSIQIQYSVKVQFVKMNKETCNRLL